MRKYQHTKQNPPLSPKEKMQYGKRDWMAH